MKRVLGIFRGFPGLGRVVAGVSLLETLRDKYDCTVKFISYLQGNKYLESRGYTGFGRGHSDGLLFHRFIAYKQNGGIYSRRHQEFNAGCDCR